MEPMRGVFGGFDIAAAGMTAELRRLEIASANIANMHVTGGKGHDPYRRRVVVFEEVLQNLGRSDVRGGEKLAGGVQVREIYEDSTSPYRKFYDESHPDAYRSTGPDDPNKSEHGWVYGTNVDLFQEMVDLMMIERSYQTKLASLRSYRDMLRNTIANIGGR